MYIYNIDSQAIKLTTGKTLSDGNTYIIKGCNHFADGGLRLNTVQHTEIPDADWELLKAKYANTPIFKSGIIFGIAKAADGEKRFNDEMTGRHDMTRPLSFNNPNPRSKSIKPTN